MRKVALKEFRDYYFARGKSSDGWSAGYWNDRRNRWKEKDLYIEDPQSSKHTRMFITEGSDFVRITFLTEEAEESLFEN